MDAHFELWKRSVIFDLRIDGASSYIFSLPFPPETFNFKQPQRVNRTKTFGGVFEDDYGLDNQTISFSGSVGGTDGWIYVENGQTIRKSSPEILFTLLDKIVQYKKRVKLEDLAKYSIQAWFLWLSPADPTGFISLNGNKVLGVECSLDDFEFSQEQSKAFRFNYKMSLFVFRQLGTFNPGPLIQLPTVQNIGTLLSSLQNSVNTFKAGVQNFTGGIKSALDQYEGYITQAADLMASIASLPVFLASQTVSVAQNLVNNVSLAVSAVGNAGISVLQDTANMLGQINSLGDAIKAVFSLPATIAAGANQALSNVQNEWTKLRDSYDGTVKTTDPYVAAGLALSGALMNPNVVTGPTLAVTLDNATYVGRYLTGPGQPTTARMFANLAMGSLADVVAAHNAWVAATMTMTPPPLTLNTTPDSPPITIYGTSTVTTQAGDTLETVATRYLGDPNYAYLLSMLNNVSSLDNVPAGFKLVIPVTTQSARNAANKVYSNLQLGNTGNGGGYQESTNPLGTDIGISSSGDIAVSPLGDVATISGQENLAQALTNRLNTPQGSFIRNVAYGLQGINQAALVPVVGSMIEDLIMQDPRILEVSDLSMVGNKDALEVSAVVTYSTGEKGRVSGVLNG